MGCMQVKHPDHNYQGMTDHKKCPDFVQDYDCRSSDIDAKYHSLQQKVSFKVAPKSSQCRSSSLCAHPLKQVQVTTKTS